MAIDFTGEVLISYITAGLPDMEFTARAILELQDTGIAAIELGVPYSDPVADGPTIARASHLSLERGTNLDRIFEMMDSLKGQIRIPVYLMSYYSPIDTYGLQKLITNCRGVGIEGMIFPDLTIEEGVDTFSRFRDAGLDPILLAFPNTGYQRVKMIAQYSGSFVYYVNLFGTTGARDKIPESSIHHLTEVKQAAGKPICAGFGVSTRKIFLTLSEYADGVIIGSAIVKRLLNHLETPSEALKSIVKFVKEILGKQ